MTNPKDMDYSHLETRAIAHSLGTAVDLLIKQARRQQKSVRQLSTAPNGAAIEKDVFEEAFGVAYGTTEFVTSIMASAWDMAIGKDEGAGQ